MAIRSSYSYSYKKRSKKKNAPPVGLIVGGLVGGAAVIGIVAAIFLQSPPKNLASKDTAAKNSASKNSATENSVTQDVPNHTASAANPPPGPSEQGARPKNNKHPSASQANSQASAPSPEPKPAVMEVRTIVPNGPDLPQAVAWMKFSPAGDHLIALPAGQNKALLWTVPGWKEKKASSPDCDYFSVPAVFSHDGKFLACQEGDKLRVWNITSSPASLANTIPLYHSEADDSSWNGIFWAKDGTLVTRNPQGGFQFLKKDDAKGAVLATSVGSGKGGLLQFGNKKFVGNEHTAGTLQIKDVVVAPNGRAFGALSAKQEKRPGFFTWLIPPAKKPGFLSFNLPGDPDQWKCNGMTISPDASQLAASLYYPGTEQPSLAKTWRVTIWRGGTTPKKTDLQWDEKDVVDFRFRAFSPDGCRAATSGATSSAAAAGKIEKRFLTVWDTDSGKKLWQADDVFTKDLFFTRDGFTLVTGAADTLEDSDKPAGDGVCSDRLDPNVPQSVDFFDVETGQRRCRFVDNGIHTFAISPDGNLLVTSYPHLAASVTLVSDNGNRVVRNLAGKKGTALAVHSVPANSQAPSDETLEQEAKERREKLLIREP